MSFQTAEMGESNMTKHTGHSFKDVSASATQPNEPKDGQKLAMFQPDELGKEKEDKDKEEIVSDYPRPDSGINKTTASKTNTSNSMEVKDEKAKGIFVEEDDQSYVPSSGGSIAFHRYFEYNSSKDNLMLAIGTFGAIVAGLFVPTIALIMGTIAQDFGGGDINSNDMSEKIAQTSWLVAGVSVIIFVFAYIFFAFWQHVAENISLRLRKLYLRALLQ